MIAVLVFVSLFVLLLVWNLADVRKGKKGSGNGERKEPDYYGSDAFSDPEAFADAREDGFPNRAAARDYWVKHSKYSPLNTDKK